MVPGDCEALLHLHQPGLLQAGADLRGLGLLLHQRLEVQQVALVVNLVKLQRHLDVLRVGRVLTTHLENNHDKCNCTIFQEIFLVT